jgi:hypothetical protein
VAFLNELRASTLPVAPDLVAASAPTSWLDALRSLAAVLPSGPAVVVLDEVPWLSEQDPAFDGGLQNAWDRLLAPRPVLLVLLGSDLHMMERLTSYDRPFYGRADNLVLGPLNPAETADALRLEPADAIDAHLLSGGLPGVLRSWPTGMAAAQFLARECADPAAPLFGVPEAALLAEFPAPDLARRVLEAVGGDQRTQANMAAAAGGRAGSLPSGTLSPLLRTLTADKQVLAVADPLSTRSGRPGLYRVTDSSLRAYLGVLRAGHELARRGRPEAAAQLVSRRWSSWRGRAVEPLVRQSLELAALTGALPWPQARVVGGWWNRRFDPEIDLVGADRGPVAGRIDFVGSVKWICAPVDRGTVATARAALTKVPGADPQRTGVVMASLNGPGPDVSRDAVDLWWGPDEMVGAWR